MSVALIVLAVLVGVHLAVAAVEMSVGTESTRVVFRAANFSEAPAWRQRKRALRDRVRKAFVESYDEYMSRAFPADELKPLQRTGESLLFGGLGLTAIDSLSTLAVMGNATEFRRAVRLVASTIDFDRDVTVSVFEANIRLLGGLISAHLIASDRGALRLPGDAAGEWWYGDSISLLPLAHDLGRRLAVAFDTPTGIPYGSINLRRGVPPGLGPITCTAAGGTFALEFGALSELTGDGSFLRLARCVQRNAMQKATHTFESNRFDLIRSLRDI